MTKRELKNKIGEQIERNMYYMTAVSTNASVTRELGNNIKLLQGINIQMSESDETEYNRGLNDAWELAQRIACQWSIGYSIEELDEIFGNERIGTASTMRNYTYQEALAKVEAYEKKKAEEAAKLEPGDVVKVIDNGNPYNTYHGVYLGTMDYSHYIQERGSHCPTTFNKHYFTLMKLDQHVDLEGWNLEE